MYRTAGLVMLPLFLATSVQARGELKAVANYTVSRVQASPDASENQTTLLLKVSQTFADSKAFWAAERRIERRKWSDRGVHHQWIDGRACPALARAMANIAKLPAMKIAAPDTPARPSPFHWPITTLRGPAAAATEGSVSVARTDFKGGVSDWWSQSEKMLEPCWRDAPVSDGGEPLRPLLGSKEDADNWTR